MEGAQVVALSEPRAGHVGALFARSDLQPDDLRRYLDVSFYS